MEGYTELFNIQHEPFMGWLWAAFGLIFVAVGTGLAVLGEKIVVRLFGGAFAAFALLWTGLVTLATWNEYATLRDDLKHGAVLAAEGRVESFQPDSPSGKDAETFSVGGVRFEIRPTEGTAAFHDALHNGGVDLRGLCARILYVRDLERNKIVWLGTRRECSSAAPGTSETGDHS